MQHMSFPSRILLDFSEKRAPEVIIMLEVQAMMQ